ncbi:MAG: MBL fold metallo-hydrolase [Leptospirales bacterium]
MKNHIRLQFLGATGYVTGSRTLLETENTKVYIDCGLYQGPHYIEEKNYKTLETLPENIDAVILTHAHIDHSGLLSLLVKEGFKGEIFCTESSGELLQILLPDAARIQEEEYKFLSKKKLTEYDLEAPLFSEQDAFDALTLIKTVPFRKPFRYRDIEFEYYWAGHILGASYVRIRAGGNTFLFSGDIGPRYPIIHKKRENPPHSDYLIMESTYGNRLHEDDDYWEKMIDAVKLAVRRKGMLLIPSFAVGRTQLILYVLYALIKNKKIPKLPIYIDSPMATRATRVYLKYPEEMKESVINEQFFEFLESKDIFLIEDVNTSKRLNFFNGPGIILSASGMCNGGRILHHLYNRIWDRRNVILFVGYQAEGTLGRRIMEGAARVKIFGRELPIRAAIKTINAFSAHADREGLYEWVEKMEEPYPKKIFINHGEDEARSSLQKMLDRKFSSEIIIPRSEEVFYFPSF